MKRVIVLLLTIIVTTTAFAQRKGNWSVGGSMGMSFGDYTSINIAPQIGYNFSRFLTLGAGVSYSYHKYKDYDSQINYLGANIFGRIYPVRFITLFIQPELQHRWGRHAGHKSKEDTFATMLVGGGVVIPAGHGNRIMAQVYYDLLQNSHTPYGSKIGFSVGYTFSF